jgi:manganese transport protein
VRTAGPAALIAAGYVDPGNWGTDVAAGAGFGYRLIWVLVAATAAALFLQHLAARLGFVTGQDLATLIRSRLPGGLRVMVVPPLLGALAVTEVVEILGVVLGVQLLTGWSALPSAATAAAVVLLVLAAPGIAARRVVYGCLAMIAFVYLTYLASHGGHQVIANLHPSSLPPGGLPVAVGLIGSVVMPHNILFHSALARELRHGDETPHAARRLLRGSVITSGLALTAAFAVNAAITSLAAGTRTSAGGLAALHPEFGTMATVLFALTLLASGLAASTSGGLASVGVLTGLVPRLRWSSALRRIVLIVPAGALAASDLPAVTVFVWSQVILTCTLPLVLVPLLAFGRSRTLMGGMVSSRPVQLAAITVTALLTAAGAASLVLM